MRAEYPICIAQVLGDSDCDGFLPDAQMGRTNNLAPRHAVTNDFLGTADQQHRSQLRCQTQWITATDVQGSLTGEGVSQLPQPLWCRIRHAQTPRP